jgi:hypothetical protein
MSKLKVSFQDTISELMGGAYWRSEKKQQELMDSKRKIGGKMDAVGKLLTPLKKITEIFPLDTEQADWLKKAMKLKANRSIYINPALDALTDLMKDIDFELARKERASEIKNLGTMHPLKKISGFATIQKKRLMDFITTYESEAKAALSNIPGVSQNGYKFTFSKNLARLLSEERKFKSENFAIAGGNVVVELSLLDMGKDNPFITQFFQDGLTDVVDEAVEEIFKLMNEYEKRLKSFAGKGSIIAKILRDIKTEGQGEIDAVVSRLNRDLPLEVDKLHEKTQKMKSSYKVYHKQVVIKIAKTSFDVLASAGGTGLAAASVATGGGAALGIAGLVLSCRALFKNVKALGQTLLEASKSATAMRQEVVASLKKQAEGFRKEAESMAKKDARKVVFNNITDFVAGISFTKTLDDLIGKCDTWMNKTYGVFEYCKKLAKPINACIGAVAILKGKIEDEDAGLQKNPPPDEKRRKKAQTALKESRETLKKLEKDLDALLKKITNQEFYSNMRMAEKSMEQLESLQQLRQKTIPPNFDKAVAFVRISADIIDTVAGAVLGGFDFATSEKAASDIAGFVVGVEDTLNGLNESGKSIKENLKDK